MWMMVLGAVCLLLGWAVIGGAVGGMKVRSQKRAFEKNHPGWEAFVSPYDGNMVAISPDGAEAALGRGDNPALCPISHILSVEILRDDGAVLTPNPLSQIAAGLAGAAAFGRMGAVLGASAAPMLVSGTVKSLVLKVITDDPARPVTRIIFFKSFSKGGAKDTSLLLRAGSDLIEKFHARLFAAAHRAPPGTWAFQAGSTSVRVTIRDRD